MIRYALRCENDHRFESWFQSGEAFEALVAGGRVECPECGASRVTKDLMSPGVRPGRKKAAAPQPMTNAPDPEVTAALKKLRHHVETTSDYVGNAFAKEARAMHEGEIPHRPIYGEARADEAKKLIEDGVPALPLPFIPRRKTN